MSSNKDKKAKDSVTEKVKDITKDAFKKAKPIIVKAIVAGAGALLSSIVDDVVKNRKQKNNKRDNDKGKNNKEQL